MRSGADYRESLRRGRKVWVMGEGWVDDITTHPATSGMVDEYVEWYDRHFDPKWQERLLTPPKNGEERRPVVFEIPETPDDFKRLGTAIYEQGFVTAGNVTHTPAYGALIALGVLEVAATMGESGGGRPEVIGAYRDYLAKTGRFLTLTGGASILGDRFKTDPAEQVGIHIVKETDAGVIVTGRTGMHTSTPFAEDIYCQIQRPEPEQRMMFAVDVNSPGATIVTRRPSLRDKSRFISPLSHRYDELEGQLWLDNVLVPWDRVFAYGFEMMSPAENRIRDRIFSILVWHHQHSFLSRCDFTLGLALAAIDAVGLRDSQTYVAQLIDLMIDCQTIRTCLTASYYEPILTPGGYMLPTPLHVASAAIYTFRNRQRMSDILRQLPGSSLVIRPTDVEFEDPEMAEAMEAGFGGGGYTAKQRAALLNLIWDHTSSSLDGRESAFEGHASGGMTAWRGRVQRWFSRYDELANRVLEAIDIEMPYISLDILRDKAASGFERPVPPPHEPAPVPSDGAAKP
jgi:4-hydroxyphenylacetate 3-monooxygenase